jgi:hypothetical protein
MNDMVVDAGAERGPADGTSKDAKKLSPVEAVEQALSHLGTVPAEELTAFIQERFGVAVNPRFVPIIREMLKDKARRAEALRNRPSPEPDSVA